MPAILRFPPLDLKPGHPVGKNQLFVEFFLHIYVLFLSSACCFPIFSPVTYIHLKRKKLTAIYYGITHILTIRKVLRQRHACTFGMLASIWLCVHRHKHPNTHADSVSGEWSPLGGTRWRTIVCRAEFCILSKFQFSRCSHKMKSNTKIMHTFEQLLDRIAQIFFFPTFLAAFVCEIVKAQVSCLCSVFI